MKKIKKYSIEIILILIIVIGMLLLFGCEKSENPNLVIGNHYENGILKVIDSETNEIIINGEFQLYEEKLLFLDIGIYKIRLIVDAGTDPALQDRTITIMINSVYTQSKVLFR